NIGNRRVRPEIEEQAVRDKATRASLRDAGLDGSRPDDATFGEHKRHVLCREFGAMKRDLLVDHLALARSHAFHVDARPLRAYAVRGSVHREVRNLRAADDVLARQARDVRTRAADQTSFDDDDRASLPPQLPGDPLAGLAATENNVLYAVAFAHALEA